MTDPVNFGDKEFDGVGYPTPSSIPDDTFCMTLSVPDDATWSALVTGVLLTLIYEENWQQFEGGISKADAAARWQVMIDDMTQEMACVRVPAPYWDLASGDDADDSAPAVDQPWYGQVVASTGLMLSAEDVTLTFVEDAFIWTVAAFIAYAGLPGAAIAFVPIARKFVLTFKGQPSGGIVHILADFLHLADIDTYSVEDKIENVSIVMPDDATTLYVEMAEEHNPDVVGTPQVAVVRKELSEAEFSNPAYRWDSECNCIQYSPDGGTTWNDAPGADMRYADAFRLPARTGSDIRCTCAANAEKWLQDFIESVISLLDAGAVLYAIVNELLRFLELIFAIVFGELVSLVLEIAGALVTLGAAVLEAAFTSDQWPLLLCAIYCNMQADGQMTAAGFAGLLDRVTADMNTTAADVVKLILNSQGQVGVSNAGAIGSATADCSGCSCTWCYGYLWQTGDPDNWNFSGDFQGTPLSGHQILVGSEYQMAGVTTMGIPSRLYMATQLHAEAPGDYLITGWSLDWTVDDVYGDTSELIRFFNAAGTQVYVYDAGIGNGGAQARTTTTVTGLSIMAAYCVIRLEARDYGVCYNLQLTGEDPNPFPGSNC